MSDGRRVAVVGGGITGLTAARRLAADGHRVSVFEGGDALGGKIVSGPFAGLDHVEAGPDAVLARVPWARHLATELGIGDDQLVSPASGHAFVAHDGELHRIPGGLILGVPAGIGGLATSRLLSTRGKLRAALDVVLPRHSVDHDSLGRLIRDRFGDEVLERLVDPLVGSINAGDADRLSLTASTPQIAPTASTSRSLLLGLRALPRPPASPSEPVFVTPRDGLGVLVSRLAEELGSAGVTVHRATPVLGIEPGRDGGWQVATVAGADRFDGLLLACPASVAHRLLAVAAPEAAEGLGSIVHAGVVMVTLHLDDRRLLARLPEGSGYLVPKPEQLHVTAVSFASRKWAHWRPPGGGEIVRISLGRLGNETPLGFDEATCAEVALKELSIHLGFSGEPSAASGAGHPLARRVPPVRTPSPPQGGGDRGGAEQASPGDHARRCRISRGRHPCLYSSGG